MDLSREDQLDSRLPTSQYIQEPKVKPEKIGGETMMGMVENPLEPATWPGLPKIEGLAYITRQSKKTFVAFVGLLTLFNSVFDSTIPSGGIRFIAAALNVQGESQLALPTSVFLIGYVTGPLAFGPMSEVYGRRVVMIGSFVLFTIFTLACAVAPSWLALIIFRSLCGIFASTPIAVTGGIFADIYRSPLTRGRVMALSMAVTAAGPQFAPVIAGFVATAGWRWIFWVSLILAGVTLVPVLFLPETFQPALMKQPQRRGEGVVTKALARPLYMLFCEPILSFTCLYLSYASAIFFAVGAGIGLGIFLAYDSFLQRAKSRRTSWSSIEEYQRLPLACLGGPLYMVALFWLGWSASPDIHWIVPMLAGIPFGMGFFLIFVALINYLIDAYHEYAASAMAAASCCRSIFGAVLPLAAVPMFRQLGIAWGCSLLGFLSLLMSLIPFVFIRYGDKIRSRSRYGH
ncbi:MFS transporter, putative [Trichophyton benhamiae CBS 112371]|uniref:MFS transporter, putative n=1 Tax=Arthroderma benhamiae (strain ATCC MYA-4681 / CBS 112371) TaxID=663331 RepID=D4B1D4_ARTBC|nr:MFS transporter, putative [Trichophyton benhamiae CBS 112371]EFE30773.1 MFS transporter, putative [Trichophyton benhamiae CBS 112371]